MAIIRATFFFENDNKAGWSETLHNMAPDLALGRERATNLLRRRRDCLGQGVRCTYVRVSDDLVKRDSRIVIVPPGDQGTRRDVNQLADIANTSLVVRLEASALARRTLYMRGIPDACVTDSGKYTPTAAWASAFDQWAFQVVIDQWACRSRDSTSPRHSITGITQNAGTGVVTIATFTPHGVTLGNPFVVRGVKGATQVNGTWQALAIPDANTLTIKLNSLITPWEGQGTVALLGYVLAPILDVKLIRPSHRIAGRPFDSPVGRRRARTRR